MPGDGTQATSFIREFLAAPVNPFAFEVLSRGAARNLGLGDKAVSVIRFGGNASAVDAQMLALARIAAAEEIGRDVWDRLRGLERESESVIRVSSLPARLSHQSGAILLDDYSQIFTYINPVRGVLRVVTRTSSNGESANGAASHPQIDKGQVDHLVFEKLPAEVWEGIASPVADPLSRGIKKAYDPQNILNPGILGTS
jgi:FAD/FMN-containing dehydrogenase